MNTCQTGHYQADWLILNHRINYHKGKVAINLIYLKDKHGALTKKTRAKMA
jgi:hypothetical protein